MNEMVTTLNALMEMQQNMAALSGEGGAASSLAVMANKFLPDIIELAKQGQNIKNQKAAIEGPGIDPTIETPEAIKLPAAAEIAPPLDITKDNPEALKMTNPADLIKPHINALITAAGKGSDPILYADLILDMTPPEYFNALYDFTSAT